MSESVKAKVLKAPGSGCWATNPPFDDHIKLKVGELRDDIPMHCIEPMKKAGWIKLVEVSEPDPEPITEETDAGEEFPEPVPAQSAKEEVIEKTVNDILNDIVEGSKDQSEAKKKLETWGKKNLNIDIRRNKSVKNIIKDLVKKYNEKR